MDKSAHNPKAEQTAALAVYGWLYAGNITTRCCPECPLGYAVGPAAVLTSILQKAAMLSLFLMATLPNLLPLLQRVEKLMLPEGIVAGVSALRSCIYTIPKV